MNSQFKNTTIFKGKIQGWRAKGVSGPWAMSPDGEKPASIIVIDLAFENAVALKGLVGGDSGDFDIKESRRAL